MTRPTWRLSFSSGLESSLFSSGPCSSSFSAMWNGSVGDAFHCVSVFVRENRWTVTKTLYHLSHNVSVSVWAQPVGFFILIESNLLQTAISSSIKHVLNEAQIAFNFSSFGHLFNCLTLFLRRTSQGGAVINKFIYRLICSLCIFPPFFYHLCSPWQHI